MICAGSTRGIVGRYHWFLYKQQREITDKQRQTCSVSVLVYTLCHWMKPMR